MASGSNPSHSKDKGLAGNTSSPSFNFGDHVLDDWTPEQIDRDYEVAHKFVEEIPSDDYTTQQNKKQSREPSELNSEIFANHFSKMPDHASGSDCYFAVCNYCEQRKKYKFRKGGSYGNMNIHMAKDHSDKLGIEKTQIQLAKGFTANSYTPSKNQGNTSALSRYTSTNC